MARWFLCWPLHGAIRRAANIASAELNPSWMQTDSINESMNDNDHDRTIKAALDWWRWKLRPSWWIRAGFIRVGLMPANESAKMVRATPRWWHRPLETGRVSSGDAGTGRRCQTLPDAAKATNGNRRSSRHQSNCFCCYLMIISCQQSRIEAPRLRGEGEGEEGRHHLNLNRNKGISRRPIKKRPRR